jgi:soluble lytic murein transglycosylase-like protein
MPTIRRYLSDRSPSPRSIPSSFPAMAQATETIPISSRRTRAAGFVIVATIASVVLAARTVSAETTPRVVSASDQSAVEPFAAFIAEAAQRFDLPASWIRAVMQVESNGDVHALSPKGAMGLMQIMPETWTNLQADSGLGADPYDPHDNILAGAAYLRELHDRYGSAGFLAAYNAGPTRYENHLKTGQPLPDETRAYVALLAPLIDERLVDGAINVATVERSWTDAPLFAAHADSSPAKPEPSADARDASPSNSKTAEDWTALAPRSDGLFVTTAHRNPQP